MAFLSRRAVHLLFYGVIFQVGAFRIVPLGLSVPHLVNGDMVKNGVLPEYLFASVIWLAAWLWFHIAVAAMAYLDAWGFTIKRIVWLLHIDPRAFIID